MDQKPKQNPESWEDEKKIAENVKDEGKTTENVKDEGKASGGATIQDFHYEKYAEVERKAVNTNGTAALIFGVLSIICLFFFVMASFVLGIAGIIFGIIGRKNADSKTIATAGLVCSIIGLAASVIIFVGAIFIATFLMFL